MVEQKNVPLEDEARVDRLGASAKGLLTPALGRLQSENIASGTGKLQKKGRRHSSALSVRSKRGKIQVIEPGADSRRVSAESSRSKSESASRKDKAGVESLRSVASRASSSSDSRRRSESEPSSKSSKSKGPAVTPTASPS